MGINTVRPMSDCDPLIAVIEHDATAPRSLAHVLQRRGYLVRGFGDPITALDEFASLQPQLVLLGHSHVDPCAFLRIHRSLYKTPVLVAGTRDDDRDEQTVQTVEAEADGYLAWPFSAAVLDARVRAMLRRTSDVWQRGPLVVGGLVIDPAAHQVRLDGVRIALTRVELEMLAYLADRGGEVVSRRDLARDVWCRSGHASDKTINVHLSSIRKKLGESPSYPRYLHTVRGVGIRLHAPDQRSSVEDG